MIWPGGFWFFWSYWLAGFKNYLQRWYITNPFPFFEFCPSPSNLLKHYSSFAFVFWMNGRSHHIWCAIQKDLAVFYAIRYKVYWGLTHVVFCLCSDLISHTHTDTHTTHAGANRLTHPYKYISTPPVICSQQLPVLHCMINSLISKMSFTGFYNAFGFQKLLTYRSHMSFD